MKQKVYILAVTVALIGLLMQTGCKTGEDCTFDITGSWQISFVMTGLPLTLSDIATFSGTAISGTTTGFSSFADLTGTYTVSNCSTVMFTFPESNADLWTFNGTAPSDNYMSGTLTWFDDSSASTDTGTWTATRL
jgi:hypothetical protein